MNINRRQFLSGLGGAALSVPFAGSALAQISDAENHEIDTYIKINNMAKAGHVALWYREKTPESDYTDFPLDEDILYLSTCNGAVREDIARFFEKIETGQDGRSLDGSVFEVSVYAAIGGDAQPRITEQDVSFEVLKNRFMGRHVDPIQNFLDEHKLKCMSADAGHDASGLVNGHS